MRILPSITKGWHDIAIPVQGGGIIGERVAILRFNGRAYPSNPSIVPLMGEAVGRLGMETPLSPQGTLVY